MVAIASRVRLEETWAHCYLNLYYIVSPSVSLGKLLYMDTAVMGTTTSSLVAITNHMAEQFKVASVSRQAV